MKQPLPSPNNENQVTWEARDSVPRLSTQSVIESAVPGSGEPTVNFSGMS